MALIQYLTRIQFEAGAIRLLGEELARLGCRQPLLVSDPGLARSAVLATVKAALPDGVDATLFAETPANPTEAAVLAGLEAYRAGGCDGVIAVGGGSPIDLAKAVRLLATHPPPLATYAVVNGGMARISADQPPLIAIPTTAGTGSEVGRASMIVMADGRKLGLLSPHIIPSLALIDPELTRGMPPGITAGTGMDAIAHCIETYLAPAVNPPAEAIALDGLARAVGSIRTAVGDGANLGARWQMSMAAMMGAMAFQKGLGAVHALSHALGGLAEPSLHHGTLNAVLLPAVLRFNVPHVPEKMGVLAKIVGVDSAAALPGAIAALTAELGLPTRLSAMGVPAHCLGEMAEAATRDHTSATNPVVPTAADYLVMLREAF